MKIECQNQFCIYYENSQCVLDSISLDTIGVCENGIHVNIEEKHLVIQRKKLINFFEQQDNRE